MELIVSCGTHGHRDRIWRGAATRGDTKGGKEEGSIPSPEGLSGREAGQGGKIFSFFFFIPSCKYFRHSITYHLLNTLHEIIAIQKTFVVGQNFATDNRRGRNAL